MATKDTFTKEDLIDFKPKFSTFVGIDSDGCVFDTMEIKQKQCFHGLIVSHWNLEPIEKYVRESAEFVNLYSAFRGQNRFIALIKSFDLIRDRKEVVESGVEVPMLSRTREYINSGLPLGNATLADEVERTNDPELKSLLQWSYDVNDRVEEIVQGVEPFPWALKSLIKMQDSSDDLVVSQTPEEALVREWKLADIFHYVEIIAGQELGTKTEHLHMATEGKYDAGAGKILMIGDAPGDMKAAKSNNALFFPVNPGQEDASWKVFYEEAYDKFLAGEYAGEYEDALIADFEKLLPDTPNW
ncbi:MAG: HAD family hydrolase [Kiritimatiellae bacterium]|jgi:phosphoglycolate phosphatase-like HAD superfamily hydrolase|nr:HAD family hydrolase [Kiritimatiellia bacterium]